MHSGEGKLQVEEFTGILSHKSLNADSMTVTGGGICAV